MRLSQIDGFLDECAQAFKILDQYPEVEHLHRPFKLPLSLVSGIGPWEECKQIRPDSYRSSCDGSAGQAHTDAETVVSIVAVLDELTTSAQLSAASTQVRYGTISKYRSMTSPEIYVYSSHDHSNVTHGDMHDQNPLMGMICSLLSLSIFSVWTWAMKVVWCELRHPNARLLVCLPKELPSWRIGDETSVWEDKERVNRPQRHVS